MKTKQKHSIQQELAKLRRQKSVLWLGVLFFVAVVVWTTFSIFSSQKEVKLDPNLSELAKPLIPRLNQSVFGLIESKRAISSEDLETFPIYVYLPVDEKKGGVMELVNIIEVLGEEGEAAGQGEFGEEGEKIEAPTVATASASEVSTDSNDSAELFPEASAAANFN